MFGVREQDAPRGLAALVRAIVGFDFLKAAMPNAPVGDERLRPYEVVDRARSGVLGRVCDGRERDVGALSKVLERTKLRANIRRPVAVQPAHAGGDRVERDEADVAFLRNRYFQLVEVLGDQELTLLIVGLDVLQHVYSVVKATFRPIAAAAN
jgi:hypothetical protein